MQPVRLIIPGNYWDSQIYSGRLYLFGQDGSISTLDWDTLISEWEIEQELSIAMECALKNSNYLYGNNWALMFSDKDIKKVIVDKFKKLVQKDLVVSSKQFKNALIDTMNNPFPFPHNDSTIYMKNIYVAAQSGVYRSTCGKTTKFSISMRPEKKWDAPVLALSASYKTLALASGTEGLFELSIDSHNRYQISEEPGRLSDKNYSDCSWTFHSIYGSSHTNSGCLAEYSKKEDRDERRTIRTFNGLIEDQQIFHSSGYSWGTRDKLCQAREGKVKIVKYTPWIDDEEDRLRQLETITLSSWKGDVVSGGVAVFGTIIECDNAIIVVPSEGSTITIPGEPINWRIFPRSKHYENQLHIIYEDRLEVLSFNHDYFVDQSKKISGFELYKGIY